MRSIGAVCVVCLLACACGGGEPGNVEPAPAPEASSEAPPQAPTGVPASDVAPALREEVARAPDDPAARRRLAIGLHGVGRRHESIEHFERLVELSPVPRHLLDLALAYQSVDRSADATATYERLLVLSPEDPIALHNLGNIELRRGANEAALAFYDRAIAADPSYALAHYHRGEALARMERFEEAYRSYEAVLEIEPHSPQELQAADDALYKLASIDLAMGAHERAAAFLAEVIKANPGHPQAHHAYGQALMQLGRREEALAQFDEHMRIQAAREPSGPVATGD